MTIEKFPSGFYAAIQTNGHIIASDLIPWDGKRGTNYPYNIEGETDYYIDHENNVYYVVHGGDTGYWCSGNRLNAHCHYLHQLRSR